MAKKLMIPGPTEVGAQTLAKMALPMQPHYGAEWAKFYFDVVEKVKRVFQTKNSLYILAATSSAAMEAGVAHAVEPGQKILICQNGFFGERFEEIAVAVGAAPVVVRCEYGRPVAADQVRRALDEHPDIKALAVVHNETSTGVESDLSAIIPPARERGVLTIVDTVSSLGAVDVPVDGLGIDFCLTGTQKCLGAPPGLAFLSVSDRAWSAIAARQTPVRSWYLSLNVLKKYQETWRDWHPQGPNTAAVPLYLALDQALDEIFAEGLPQRFARHVRARDAFRAAMRAMGLRLFVEDACASKTLTAVCLPEGIDGAALRRRISDHHDILVAGGLGATANTVIRVGHMALTASPKYLLPAVAAIETELLGLGAKINKGAGAEAFRRVFPEKEHGH